MAIVHGLFTSESVTEGHPDKVADQISDALLDELLKQDSQARVACETLVKTGMAVVAGEISTSGYVDIPAIVRQTISSIGYRSSLDGFDGQTCAVLTAIERQSPDIAQGVDRGDVNHQGAGDQGMMFGYACKETPGLMPAPIYYAHQLAQRLAHVRHTQKVPFLAPDGKTQVTFVYEQSQPIAIDTIVVSAQHRQEATDQMVKDAIMAEVIEPVIPAHFRRQPIRYFINPTGRFVIGGPMGDAGLTGRKIIVDTYGGMGRHGGGAFSGKDPSKVDRSGAYFARYIAKNIVAADLADRCEVQVSYAIGIAEPVSLMVETFGTGRLPVVKLNQIAKELFVARPAEMIRRLQLLRPIYRKTACYGHFGRDEPEFTWEKTDGVTGLRALAGSSSIG